MRNQWSLIPVCAALIGVGLFADARADELTQRIQNDLVALGYEPGNIGGEATTETAVAIAKFQAEHGLVIDGQVSPALAGVLAAEISKRDTVTPADITVATPAQSAESQAQARRACLEEKIAKAQKAQSRRRGLDRLVGATSRVAWRTGNHAVGRAMDDTHVALTVVDDVAAAARDLGITQSEIEACDRL